MNNKGFTLTEVLAVLVVISLVAIIAINGLGKTLSISKEESYNIMKKNIISASYNYINECTTGTITCDFSFDKNNKFNAGILKEKGYFKSMNSQLDGKDLSNCLIIEATRKNGVIVSNLHDNCYEK